MGKFKRIKDIFNKVKKLIKDAGDKVIKPVIKKVIKHAPGLMKVLVKVIKATDKVGARRVILNLIPEAGPYVNQAVDYLIKAQEKGVIDDACSLFQKVIDGRIDMKTFIEDVKKLIGDVAQIEVDGMPNPLKIVDQVVNSNGGTENKPTPKILPQPKGKYFNPDKYQGLDVFKRQREANEKAQELADERKLMRGDRETLLKEALAREAEENGGYAGNEALADEIFGPPVNK